MEPVVDVNQLVSAESLFTRLIQTNPENWPIDRWFRPCGQKDIRLLFPTSYRLEDAAFSALSRITTRMYSETGAFLRILEGYKGQPPYWHVRWSGGPDYEATVGGLLENCLYSPSGHWAILFFSERFAVISAPHPFIAQIDLALPRSFEEQEHDLVDYVAQCFAPAGVEPLWLRPLLTRLKGKAATAGMLKRSGL